MTILANTTILAQQSEHQKVKGENFVTVDGVKLHYRKGGQGPYLLLFHGFTLSSHQWSEYFSELSENYTVIAFDFPGHGQSERTGKEFSFDHWTKLMIKAIDKLGVNRAKAIGHSYGAITLMSIAMQQPKLIESMVLISGAHRLDPAMQEILLEDSFEKADADFQEYYRKIHNNDMQQIDGIFSDIRKFVRTREVFSVDEIREIQIPILLIFGDRDTFYPMEIPIEMYNALPNASLWVLPDQGHTPVWKTMGADDMIVGVFSKRVHRFLSK
ncbi:alpha/beta fold hydrolase [Flagellimonas lutaonensis]|nr:alpha/beta hydrolase [Allomuricauda lutaonensis]